MTIEGGCICGAVRYHIEEETPPCYACHCTDCQSQSGSGWALQMPVPAAKFHVDGPLTSGERTLPSGAVGTVHCCALCLVRLYSTNSARPGIVIVRAGTLDDRASLVPAAHMWTRSKQSWIAIPADARSFDTNPDSEAEWRDILEFERRSQ